MKMSAFCRRLVCCTLVFLLLMPSAMADSINLSSLSDAEVVELLGRVNAELASRGINKTAKLPQGAYVAGKEIPAGRYIFTVMATGNDWGNVTVYSEGGKGKQLLWEVVSAPEKGEDPETIFITLEEGDQLKSGVPFSLTIMSGAIFQ